MTLAQTHDTLLDGLAQKLPLAKRRRFFQGVEALSRGRFISLNAAGRGLAKNPAAGLSRIWRLATDKDLAASLQTALIDHHLGARSGRVWLNIDHTSLGNFTACVLAVQTGRGRAIPCFFQINPGSTNAAVRPLLLALEELASQLEANPRLRPVLVGDRWFGSQKLMDFCQGVGWGFVFRTKTDKIVDTPAGKMPIDQICQYDSRVEYRGQPLRLVLSKLRPGMTQPWWLLTNLETSHQRLLQRYANRWEIESTFRDMKSVQGLRGLRLHRAVSLHNLLLFASLAWAILAPLAGDIPAVHPKKTLSWFHCLFEAAARAWSGPKPSLAPT